MPINSTILGRLLTSFRKNTGGNVALTFAAVAIPLIGCVGTAVDFSRANSVKASMQAALDSTALMLSKNISTLNQDQFRV